MPKQCFGSEQVYVGLDGSVRACCIASEVWHQPSDPDFDSLFETKLRCNQSLAEGDSSECSPNCSALYEYSGPRSFEPRKIVVYTNTLCPMRCGYCSQAQPSGDDEKLLVQQPHNNIGGLERTLEKVLSAPGALAVREIELSGGDSAFHPEFEAILDLLSSFGTKTIYLSSGIVPPAVRGKIREKLASGDLTISVSPDAMSPTTWSRVKRRPAAQFGKVVEFIDDALAHAVVPEQLWIKFIAQRKNLHEAGAWIPWWHQRGVRGFAYSEYRLGQAVDIGGIDPSTDPETLMPPADADLARAAVAADRSFERLPVDTSTWLALIGTERFFGDQSSKVRRPPGGEHMALGGPRFASALDSQADQLVARSRVATRQRATDAAHRLVMRALEFAPRHPQAHCDLARHQLQIGDHKAAANHLEVALAGDPQDEGIRQLARAVVAAARQAEAVRVPVGS